MHGRTTRALGTSAVFAVVVAGTVLAAGEIVVERTQITVGAAATRGSIVITTDGDTGTPPEVAAPVAPIQPDPLEEYSGIFLRELPAHRSGDAAFHATTSATIAGGTYDYTTITVDPGVVLTYTGPVVLRAGGDVLIEGSIRANGSGAGVTILCDGDLVVRTAAGYAAPSIQAGSYPATVAIDSFGDVVVAGTAAAPCAFRSSLGVFLSSRGAGKSLDVAHARFSASAHGVYLRSEGDAILLDADLEYSAGGMLVASFGGDAVLAGCDIDTGGLGFRLTATGSVTVDEASRIECAHTYLQAESGALAITGGSTYTVNSYVATVYAGDGISIVEDSAFRNLGRLANVSVTATGGDIRVGVADGDASELSTTGSGRFEVRSAGGVAVVAGSAISAVDGALAIDASGGSVIVGGTVASRYGALEVRASDTAEFTGAAATGSSVTIEAAGGVTLAGGATAKDGAIRVVAEGDVALRGGVSASADVFVATTGGALDAAGADVATAAAADVSGSIVLECWDNDRAAIDLTDASLATGAAATQSGDVVAWIRTAAAAAPDDPAAPGDDDAVPGDDDTGGEEESPDAAVADTASVDPMGRARVRSGRHGAWTFAGACRLGADGATLESLGATATLGVDGESRTLDLAGTPRRGGAVYRGDGCTLRVRTERGTDALICEIRWRGDRDSAAPRDGDVAIRLAFGDVRGGASLSSRRDRAGR